MLSLEMSLNLKYFIYNVYEWLSGYEKIYYLILLIWIKLYKKL